MIIEFSFKEMLHYKQITDTAENWLFDFKLKIDDTVKYKRLDKYTLRVEATKTSIQNIKRMFDGVKIEAWSIIGGDYETQLFYNIRIIKE